MCIQCVSARIVDGQCVPRVGEMLGLRDGLTLGLSLGLTLGETLGLLLGLTDGDALGLGVGFSVGAPPTHGHRRRQYPHPKSLGTRSQRPASDVPAGRFQ